jgi:hypothetical protein
LSVLRMALTGPSAPWAGPPLRPWHAVRQPRLDRPANGAPDRHQHGPESGTWDNAACGSFMKALQYQEVFRNEYRDRDEARSSILEFLEKVYNEKRYTRRLATFRRPSSSGTLPRTTRMPLRGEIRVVVLDAARIEDVIANRLSRSVRSRVAIHRLSTHAVGSTDWTTTEVETQPLPNGIPRRNKLALECLQTPINAVERVSRITIDC